MLNTISNGKVSDETLEQMINNLVHFEDRLKKSPLPEESEEVIPSKTKNKFAPSSNHNRSSHPFNRNRSK